MFNNFNRSMCRKRPKGIPRCRWEVDNNIDFKEIGVKRAIGLIWFGIGIFRDPL